MKRFMLALVLLSLLCTPARAEFKLPASLQSIGEEAFLNVPIRDDLDLPEALFTIGRRAFITNLSIHKTVLIPPSVTFIADLVFDSTVRFLVEESSYGEKWCQDNNYSYDLIGSNKIELQDYLHIYGERAGQMLNLEWKQSPGSKKMEGFFTDGEVYLYCDKLRRNFPGGIVHISLQGDSRDRYTLCGLSISMDVNTACRSLIADGWTGPEDSDYLLEFKKRTDDGETYTLVLTTSADGLDCIDLSVRNQMPKCRALLIGVETFKDSDGNPEIQKRFMNDLTLVEEGLHSFVGSDYEVRTCKDPSSINDIRDACDALFGSNGDDDISIIFISTHGKYPTSWKKEKDLTDAERAGKVFIAGDMSIKDNNLLTPIALAECLSHYRGTKLVLLGSCLSGNVLLGDYGRVFQREGIRVITATKAGQSSYGIEEKLFGLWAAKNYFADTIREALTYLYADTNPRDGTITMGEFYDFLYKYVPENTKDSTLIFYSVPQTNIPMSIEYYAPLFWKDPL